MPWTSKCPIYFVQPMGIYSYSTRRTANTLMALGYVRYAWMIHEGRRNIGQYGNSPRLCEAYDEDTQVMKKFQSAKSVH